MLLVAVAAGALTMALLAVVQPALPARLPPVLVWAAAAAGAVAVALAGAAPTGWEPLDLVLRAGFGALVPIAAARAGTAATCWLLLVSVASLFIALDAPGGLVAGVTAGAFWALTAAGATTPAAAAIAAAAAVGPMASMDWPVATGVSAAAVAVAALPVLLVGLVRTGRPLRRRITIALAAVVVLLGLGAAAGLLAALSARTDIDRAVDLATSGIERLGDDDEQARSDLRDAAGAFASAEEDLTTWWARPALAVPGVAQQARAVATMASSGADLARTAADASENADVDSIRPRNGRIDLEALAALEGPLDRSVASLHRADRRLDDVDTPLLVGPLAERLQTLREEVDDALGTAELAALVVDVAPDMLGGDGARRYFVAFQNPAEQRGNGGYMGNWAELTVEDGAFSLTRSGRIRELFEARPDELDLVGLDELVDIYGYRARSWGTHNYSPDNPSVSAAIAQLYPESGGAPVDGVINLTPAGLAGFLELTGPVQVPGYPDALTADDAERILLHEQYLEFSAESNEERTAFLEDAVQTVFQRVVSGDLPGAGAIADALGPAAEARDLQLWSSHDAEQALFERLDIDGSAERDGVDSFGVVSQNFNGNKIDWFLHRDVAYDAHWDPRSGTVDGTMTVTFENRAPASGLPHSVIGWGGDASSGHRPVADGENFMAVTLYTTFPVQEVTVDGRPQEVTSVRELGHHAQHFFLSVPPTGRRVVKASFSGMVAEGASYAIRALRQPVANPDSFTARVSVPPTFELTTSPKPHDPGETTVSISGTSRERFQEDLVLRRSSDGDETWLDRLRGDR